MLTDKAGPLKRILWALEMLFCTCCVIYSVCTSQYPQALGCAASVFLVSLPTLFEKLTKEQMKPVVFICFSIYALGPMIGDVFQLYYVTSWWDKLLHFVGGIVFAWFGAFLSGLIDRKNTVLTRAALALCFSIALSAVWEFAEFGMDCIFGTDAQHDTVVTSIHSYLLGDEKNKVSSIDDIRKTVINGTEIDGYIDIGLYDTMTDMIFETVGALAFSAVYLLREKNSG